MPASNKRKSEANQAAIPLHDGPLHRSFKDESLLPHAQVDINVQAQNANDCDSDDDRIFKIVEHCIHAILTNSGARIDTNDTISMQPSTIHPMNKVNMNAMEDINSPNSIFSCTMTTLGGILLSSKSIHDQLTCLRSYRSQLLHHHKQSSHDGADSSLNREERYVKVLVASAMYRILLEWSISHKTTSALRRASYSCLNVLLSHIHSETDQVIFHDASKEVRGSHSILRDIHASVLQSLSSGYLTKLSTSPTSSPSSSSLFHQSNAWKDPVHSLFQLMTYEPTMSFMLAHPSSIVQSVALLISVGANTTNLLHPYFVHPQSTHTDDSDPDDRKLAFDGAGANGDAGIFSITVVNAMDTAVKLCTTLKELITRLVFQQQQRYGSGYNNTDNIATSTSIADSTGHENEGYWQLLYRLLTLFLEHVLIPVLRCKVTSTDAVSICGVCLGHVLYFQWKLSRIGTNETCNSDCDVAILVKTFLSRLVQEPSLQSTTDHCGRSEDEVMTILKPLSNTPPLATLSIVKGIAASFPVSILLESGNEETKVDNRAILIHPIGSYISHLSEKSTGNVIRLSALKALQTVLAGCQSGLVHLSALGAKEGSGQEQGFASFIRDVRHLTDDTLRISLSTWESPPCRQVESAVPSLFQSLIDVKEALHDVANACDKDEENALDVLVERVLAQPPNRKGRYVALDLLLPKVGVFKLLSMGHVAKGVEHVHFEADNVKEILSSEQSSSLIYQLVQGIGDGGGNSGAIAELLGKLISLVHNQVHDYDDSPNIENKNYKWRRKKDRELERKQKLNKGDITGAIPECRDQIESVHLLPEWVHLWAKPISDCLVSSDLSRRNQVASFALPLITTFVGGPSRRLHACQAFAALLEVIESHRTAIDTKKNDKVEEKVLWAKLKVIEHAARQKLLKKTLLSMSTLRQSISKRLPLQTLEGALQHEAPYIRLAAFQAIADVLPAYDDTNHSSGCYLHGEVELYRRYLPIAVKSSEKEYIAKLMKFITDLLRRMLLNEIKGPTGDPLLEGFVSDFLVRDLLLKQCAYPGTSQAKESWSLFIVNAIITFVRESDANLKCNQMKRMGITESEWKDRIMSSLLKDEVTSCLITLLHSIWDSTREKAYDLMCQIITYAKKNSLDLPDMVSSGGNQRLLKSRGFHLASSPRQRESDTGSRLLAIICIAMPVETQFAFLQNLTEVTEARLGMMEHSLGVVSGAEDQIDLQNENEAMPLAHGLLQCLSLIVEKVSIISLKDAPVLFERLVRLCYRAIEMSLVVVADMKDDDSPDDLSKSGYRWMSARAKGTPLNVNTGALGANTHDTYKMQRMMVGTWLVMKEACASIAILFSRFSSVASYDLISAAGHLLISALTSLKHQGAAFAASKALQVLCFLCNRSKTADEVRSKLPSLWAKRILHEISAVDIVRDSTLRRSTGYGLGILSVLRSERRIFSKIIANIIRLSLPPVSIMNNGMTKGFGLSSGFSDIFVYSSHINETTFVKDNDYEWRGRVHAQNILRLVILDAPLSTDMRCFVGDAILSSLVGYKDRSWAVRNSSTMTFAAAMLRVIDADKNADKTSFDVQASKGNGKAKGGAITVRELHRSYPELVTSLISMLEDETSDMSSQTYPALYPILLLLSRLQPCSITSIDYESLDISDSFVDTIMRSLSHREYKVRVMAARALATICTEGQGSNKSNRSSLLNECLQLLSINSEENHTNVRHNNDHGALLGIQALLFTSPTFEYSFEEKLFQAITFYASWCYGTCDVAPPCVSTAMQICYHLSKSSMTTGRFEQESMICNKYGAFIDGAAPLVVRMVQHVEETDRNSIMSLAGLGAVAASIACSVYCDKLFDSRYRNEGDSYMDRLVGLITNTSYDVRVYSIKTLKKRLLSYLSRSHSCTQNLLIIEKLCGIFVNVLNTNLKIKVDGVHPPTLRRLSRCAIEAISFIRNENEQSTNIAKEEFFPELDSALSLEFWTNLNKMYAIGCSVNAKKGKEVEAINGSNPLAGNALELTSLFLTSLRDNLGDTEDCKEDYLRSFVQSICDSTSSSNWAVRHSAVTACDIIQPSEKSGHERFISNDLCLKLYMQVLKLLQDDDVDVRSAASRIISRNPEVELITLKEAMCRMVNEYHIEDVIHVLISQLIHLTQGLEEIIDSFNEERNTSICISQLPSSLLNLSTKRKIFEEEKSNPFDEPLVTAQFALFTLMNHVPFKEVTCSITEHDQCCLQQLAIRCKQVLSQMQSYPINMDTTHDWTWSRDAFPKLFSLVLTCCASRYFGLLQDDELILQAQQSMVKSCIQPSIRESIKILIHSKKGCKATLERIVNSCALIPNK